MTVISRNFAVTGAARKSPFKPRLALFPGSLRAREFGLSKNPRLFNRHNIVYTGVTDRGHSVNPILVLHFPFVNAGLPPIISRHTAYIINVIINMKKVESFVVGQREDMRVYFIYTYMKFAFIIIEGVD